MKNDDLTQVKYIGPSRMKLLNDFGITTIKQLYETPQEKLCQVESISGHYAKLIKDAVTEYYGDTSDELTVKTVPGKEQETLDIDRNLRKRIKALNRRIKQAREQLN
jgi:predicted RecB family nuclease